MVKKNVTDVQSDGREIGPQNRFVVVLDNKVGQSFEFGHQVTCATGGQRRQGHYSGL